MSKRDFVCFDCRSAVRQEPYSDDDVLCPSCGQPTTCLGYKIRIPPKSKTAAWDQLRDQFIAEQLEYSEANEIGSVRRKHALEKEIIRLETKPSNPGILGQLKKLRAALKTHDA